MPRILALVITSITKYKLSALRALLKQFGEKQKQRVCVMEKHQTGFEKLKFNINTTEEREREMFELWFGCCRWTESVFLGMQDILTTLSTTPTDDSRYNLNLCL